MRISDVDLILWHVSQLLPQVIEMGTVAFLVFTFVLGSIAWYFCRAVGRGRNTGDHHGGGMDAAPNGIESVD